MLTIFARQGNYLVMQVAQSMLVLFSYETAAAYIVPRTGEMALNSSLTTQTTRKHMAKFFRDYAHAALSSHARDLSDGTFNDALSQRIAKEVVRSAEGY